MLFHSVRTRQTKEAAVFRHETRGVVRFSRQLDRGYAVEIWRRKLGLTVKRTLYNVAIFNRTGERVAFLADFASLDRARRAAEERIDTEIKAEKRRGEQSWSSVAVPRSPAKTRARRRQPGRS